MQPNPARDLTNVLVTGGAGFIGSAFVRSAATEGFFRGRIVVLDALTYAGNLENLAGVEGGFDFVHGDICDEDLVRETLDKHQIDSIVHFAAESHVDRSILGPLVFTRTNVLGTHSLVEAAQKHGVKVFLHVSTDEVYGALGKDGAFTEATPLNPTSPYAASKAASDLVVMGYVKTFGFPAVVTRCSNNYGPYQFPEKLIPLMITNAMRDMPLPVYGDGRNVRDWLHTGDHVSALHGAMKYGRVGEVYNIGGKNEWENIDVVRAILKLLGKPESLMRFVADRPAHDRRYAIDPSKISRELGWTPEVDFEEGLRDTVQWYSSHETWWKRVMTGEYVTYYEKQYLLR